MIACNEIISVVDIASTKMTNTVATNVWINFHSEKVRCKNDSYILNSVLPRIILLMIITNICHYHAKHRSKQNPIVALTM